MEFLGLQGKHNSSSHGTVPGFFRRLANEHAAQDFAAKEPDLRIGWLAREKAEIWPRIFVKRSEEGFVGLEMLRRQ